jgi:flagellar protein FlaG
MLINKVALNNLDAISQNQQRISKNAEGTKAAPESSFPPDMKLSTDDITNLVDTLNAAAKSVNKRIEFSYHDKINRVIMKVMDTQSNEVIREIPAKEMIRLLEHIHDLIGMFVDEAR